MANQCIPIMLSRRGNHRHYGLHLTTTVPGGTDETTGIPILRGRPAIGIFTITSLIALCFSLASLTLFLSILTSHYNAIDFLRSLPRKGIRILAPARGDFLFPPPPSAPAHGDPDSSKQDSPVWTNQGIRFPSIKGEPNGDRTAPAQHTATDPLLGWLLLVAGKQSSPLLTLLSNKIPSPLKSKRNLRSSKIKTNTSSHIIYHQKTQQIRHRFLSSFLPPQVAELLTGKMQASMVAAGGNVGSKLQNHRFPSGIAGFRKRVSGVSNLCMVSRGFCSESSPSSVEAKIACSRMGVHTFSQSEAKARSVRAQAYDGGVEDAASGKVQARSSGSVLPYVGVACLGAILFGYHLGVVNGALEYLAKDLGIAENTVGLSAQPLRVPLLVLSLEELWLINLVEQELFSLMQSHLLATSQSVQTMIIGRVLAGIGIGISSAIVPLYISEISPTEIRGALGSVNQLFICIGILAALVAGLPLAGNPLWWRTMFGIAVVPSVLMALGMAISPESPRWLFQQGKISQAEAAIKSLFGKEKVAEVMHDLRSRGQSSTEQDAGWFDLFSKRYWKVVSVGAALFLFQQLAGINAVVYYSTSVFRSAGIASDVAASALVGASNVFGTAIASSLMDRQGRKSLLITSFTGMAASMLLLSLSFTWKVLAPYSGTLAVLGTVLYVLSFSLGAGPVPALLLPEIFASRIRAKAVALSLGMHWVSNFVIGLYFLSVVNRFGISKVYLGFATVCLLAVLYIAGNVVETKGRSLEEIERALSSAA
ncbi:plastidic glucose transporter 4-like protein isoform X2 [Cinnamomum micranthum f. kanehirae]|uniref:Plastidic glucose transporter 4-like protein isoform X2 n=1 Tax=Cinnamomum micranthum f. kanehirae TaxID=337451 RepID=A0A3S3P6V3_9MAGN|nr:plastidic glucose transporter 4-like protein isoform X2 [Cinnamomum micranthum f. kanehirae]